MNCHKCGQEVFMPFRCPYCGDQFCSEHRLPENHMCPRIELAHTPKKVPIYSGQPGRTSYEYSVTFGPQRTSRGRVYFGPKEVRHLSIAALLVIGIGFSIALYGNFFEFPFYWTWPIVFVFALILMGSFLIHEVAHKFMAQRRGLWAEFRLTTWGAIITLLSVISPIKLIAPGAVVISGSVRLNEIAKISIAGPAINIALGAIFLAASIIPGPTNSLFIIAAFINATIAVFNLIPFGILDGYKIYSWSKTVWALGFAFAVALAIPSYIFYSQLL